jgi:hypothetical protein
VFERILYLNSIASLKDEVRKRIDSVIERVRAVATERILKAIHVIHEVDDNAVDRRRLDIERGKLKGNGTDRVF